MEGVCVGTHHVHPARRGHGWKGSAWGPTTCTQHGGVTGGVGAEWGPVNARHINVGGSGELPLPTHEGGEVKSWEPRDPLG